MSRKPSNSPEEIEKECFERGKDLAELDRQTRMVEKHLKSVNCWDILREPIDRYIERSTAGTDSKHRQYLQKYHGGR